MGEPSPASRAGVGILDVLRVDLCARALLDLVPVADLVRSERVCTRWQAVVLEYLRGCRTLGIKIFRHISLYHPKIERNRSRIMPIFDKQNLHTIVSKVIDKWGNYITAAILNLEEVDILLCLDTIASKCPNLSELELTLPTIKTPPSLNWLQNVKHLKQIVLIGFWYLHDDGDLVLAELFRNKCYENVSVQFTRFTGLFLKFLEPNCLKSLSLLNCSYLKVSELRLALCGQRSLINLELEILKLNDVGLLLKEMPQLEDLKLQYECDDDPIGKEFIEALSSLANLKRLDMDGRNSRINDAFMEALTRGKKLVYLRINDPDTIVTARGVVALGCTALDLTRFEDAPDEELEEIFFHFKEFPLYKELEAQGVLELNLELFKAAVRSPYRTLALNPRPGASAPRDGDLRKELKFFILWNIQPTLSLSYDYQ